VKKVWYLVPVVGALAVGFAFGHFNRRPVVASAPHRVLYYVDPMHPAYHSDKPGKAPDCGMDLEPVYADTVGKSGGNWDRQNRSGSGHLRGESNRPRGPRTRLNQECKMVASRSTKRIPKRCT
jgi:hypothetical protein